MFVAIKGHYDQGKKAPGKAEERRAVLRASGKVAAVFVLALLGLGVFAFGLLGMLGNDLTMP
jgi:hypothetical protein